MSDDCMGSQFLCSSELHLGKMGHGFDHAGDSFGWIFTGGFIFMVASWILFKMVWSATGAMCGHSTISKKIDFSGGIGDANSESMSDVATGATVEDVEDQVLDMLIDICTNMSEAAEWDVVSTRYRVRCFYHGIMTGNNELVNFCHRAIDGNNDSIITEDALSGLCDAKGSGLNEELQRLTRFLTRRFTTGPENDARSRVSDVLKLAFQIDVQATRDSQVDWLTENSDPANDLGPSGAMDVDDGDIARRERYRDCGIEECSDPELWMEMHHGVQLHPGLPAVMRRAPWAR